MDPGPRELDIISTGQSHPRTPRVTMPRRLVAPLALLLAVLVLGWSCYGHLVLGLGDQ